ncbi:hypothetical protein [uncultured Roseivirga sp.]|uniref:hypothetical protein n=1 Tax=uncultured Roseivirga sp. TaxID=543088 RepID=UPI0030DA1281|tara:strand:- start:19503 stop:19970 length:468 start_codon:yes stop_codon:yes gene_type:complete
MRDEKHIDPASLPLYRKGKEIFELVMKIADLIPDEDPRLQNTKQFMIQDAMMLSVKVAGSSSGVGLYDLKMEAATIIRKSARDLMVQNHALEMFNFKEAHYFDMVRNLIEEYRLLFIDWVAAFDPWDYIIDRWGLFNPPGVGPHDHDPDDDIPRE